MGLAGQIAAQAAPERAERRLVGLRLDHVPGHPALRPGGGRRGRLAILVLRLWQSRKRRKEPIASQPIQPAPDLSDESVGAEQLPEDRWTSLAREHLGRGELRLALRAFYFASLAHLAERNLISLRQIQVEPRLRTRTAPARHYFPELLALFGENVLVIDRAWYGLHQVSGSR